MLHKSSILPIGYISTDSFSESAQIYHYLLVVRELNCGLSRNMDYEADIKKNTH